MSNLLHARDGESPAIRSDGDETRIIDSEILLKNAFSENAREGCTLLFRLYYSPMFSHAIRFVYSKPVAEDIVAEVFCQFWEDRLFEKINTSYRAYLFKAVRHKAYNYVKFELAKISRNTLPAAIGDSTPNDILEYDQLYQLLEDTINKLPQQCKKVFVMSRVENKRYQEIASELGVSVKAVEAHVSRALRILRKALKHM